MSKFTDSMANELVHFEIYGAPTTDLVIIKIIDSDGNTIHSLLSDLDHLGRTSFNINSAIQDREIWLHEQEQNHD